MDDDWEAVDDYEPNQWVTLIEAVNAMAVDSRNSYRSAKDDLLEFISDGLVEMRCLEVLEEADIGMIRWNRLKGQHCHPNQYDIGFRFRARNQDDPLPMISGFWNTKDAWTIDRGRIDWTASILIGTRPTQLKVGMVNAGGRLFTRRAARGIQIRLPSIPFLTKTAGLDVSASTQIDKKLGVGFEASDRKKHGRSTPRRKKFNLAPVMVRLESEIESGEISRLGKFNDYGMTSKLEAEILKIWLELHEDCDEPTESTLRRRATHLMEIWRLKVGSE